MTPTEAREPVRQHELKTDAAVFQAVIDGRKTFEIRYDDRGFQEGDVLRLRETRYTGEEMKASAPLEYTGRECARSVSHVLRGPIYGLADGWAILSLAALASPSAQPREGAPHPADWAAYNEWLRETGYVSEREGAPGEVREGLLRRLHEADMTTQYLDQYAPRKMERREAGLSAENVTMVEDVILWWEEHRAALLSERPGQGSERCDCGEPLTQCSDCAVADYQSEHIDCAFCCPSASHHFGGDARALALLREVREACLFADDDGGIGITCDPHISEALFNRIAAALRGSARTTVGDVMEPTGSPGEYRVSLCRAASPVERTPQLLVLENIRARVAQMRADRDPGSVIAARTLTDVLAVIDEEISDVHGRISDVHGAPPVEGTPDEAKIYSENTRVSAWPGGGETSVVLVIGDQSFLLNYTGSPEETDWMRSMLAKALSTFRNSQSGAARTGSAHTQTEPTFDAAIRWLRGWQGSPKHASAYARMMIKDLRAEAQGER